MSIFTPQERVAVFRGGHTSTSALSMASGQVALEVLGASRGYQPIDVMVSAGGQWLVGGREVIPSQFLSTVDQAIIAVLGQYGEDGCIARSLERNGVRHIASSPYTALETWHKNLTHERLRAVGIHTPRQVVAFADSQVDLHSLATNVQQLFGPHYIVKPAHGTQLQDVFHLDSAALLPRAIGAVLASHPVCLIEEYVPGQSLTVTTVPGLRQQAVYHTPSVQYEHQFSDDGKLRVDSYCREGQLTRQQHTAVYQTVSSACKALNVQSAVRTDIQVTPAGDVYVIEINTIPTLTKNSPLSASLASVGVTPEEYLIHQLQH